MKILKRGHSSIQWRLNSMFFLLVLFILTAMLAANTFFLGRYYLREKVHVLETAYATIDGMLEEADGLEELFPADENSPDSLQENRATRYIRSLTETQNISVIILDTETDRTFASSANSEFLSKRLSSNILGAINGRKGRTLRRFSNYVIEQSGESGEETGYLESWGYFSDNVSCFMMSMPLSSLRESTAFFNRFLLAIGGFAIVLGGIIISFASWEITKPINALAKLSEKMSKLDFSARYCGDSEDEIGTLGKSMNILSERLESTIAELKTANNELQLDVENKRRLAQKREEFVANVSHELKTPIALIQGYAEGLMDGLAEDKESRDYYCTVISDEAKRMNRMVRELMNLSALEQGKDLPDITLFSLAKVVDGIVSSAELFLRQQDIRLEVDIPEDLKVWADEFKIEEVLTNYLNNAMHHVKEPKQISIFTEREAGDRISVHVRNTGDPIPEEELPRLWEKFYKVDKAHTRSYGGSGLGLSIVKAIAEAHHQSCGVKNTRTGVDFWFTLDREKED